MKFTLGKTVITQNALHTLETSSLYQALQRHQNGDWGDMSVADKKQNDEALKTGERLMSAYTDTLGVKFWIITESDRSATTVLLPEDY